MYMNFESFLLGVFKTQNSRSSVEKKEAWITKCKQIVQNLTFRTEQWSQSLRPLQLPQIHSRQQLNQLRRLLRCRHCHRFQLDWRTYQRAVVGQELRNARTCYIPNSRGLRGVGLTARNIIVSAKLCLGTRSSLIERHFSFAVWFYKLTIWMRLLEVTGDRQEALYVWM
jgi:hypothetical protein